MRLETYRSRAEKLAAQATGAARTGQPSRAAELRKEALGLLDDGARAMDAESLAMMQLRDAIEIAADGDARYLNRLRAS